MSVQHHCLACQGPCAKLAAAERDLQYEQREREFTKQQHDAALAKLAAAESARLFLDVGWKEASRLLKETVDKAEKHRALADRLAEALKRGRALAQSVVNDGITARLPWATQVERNCAHLVAEWEKGRKA